MPEIKIVDLFCGAGGLTFGLEAAGLKVVEGVDADERCRYPYEMNTSARFVALDVQYYSEQRLQEAWKGAEYKVLVGCAPCQPFSTYTQRWAAGKRKGRWDLIRRFAKLVEQTRPDVVSMENVPPLERTSEFLGFRNGLIEAGYCVSAKVLDCREYGAPQMRRRLVLLASKLGQIEMLPASHPNPSVWADVASTIGHLPEVEAGQTAPDDPLHRACRLSELNLARIRASKPGGTWRDWPKSLVSPCHKRATGKTYPGVYGRMEWNKPAPTITGQCFGFGNGRFGHPEQDRALTLREAALLQTFPEEFEFFHPDRPIPSAKFLGSLIGNAVPPTLGCAIGKAITKHIESMSST